MEGNFALESLHFIAAMAMYFHAMDFNSTKKKKKKKKKKN